MTSAYVTPGYWAPGYAVGSTEGLNLYLSRITSAHSGKPKFMATVAGVTAPLANVTSALLGLTSSYDLDSAVGAQLDTVGLWVGQSRSVALPLTGVYFSFDDPALGFDQGTWRGPFDPESGLSNLPDSAYRLLIRAKIALNSWDGTIPQSNAIWAKVLIGTGLKVYTLDNQDMTMSTIIGGSKIPDALTKALFKQAYLQLKPAGVGHLGVSYITVPGAPAFGLDVETLALGGFDRGAWTTTPDASI